MPERDCHVCITGIPREIQDVDPPHRRTRRFRFLTVTNSHDLERYNTLAIIDAFQAGLSTGDDVALVIKDYGASSGDTTLRDSSRPHCAPAPIEDISDFTDKRELIRLYKSCDAFVSAHRGEGFGMKILDAMACGLPVITPLFGGPTAYCAPNNCFPVDFFARSDGRLPRYSVPSDHEPADVGRGRSGRASRQQMRRVYDDRAATTRQSAPAARAEVMERFSWARRGTA